MRSLCGDCGKRRATKTITLNFVMKMWPGPDVTVKRKRHVCGPCQKEH